MRKERPLENTAKFFTDLNQLLSLYKLNVYPLTCQQIAKAVNLRKKHNLTFYDSHHVASATLYDSKIISIDNTYDSVIDLKMINPYSLE